jgi:hypothetical protein
MTTGNGAVQEARLERVRFFPRQLIGADDLSQEQRYHRQKQRNHNRLLHGWGVVCGCDVRPAADPRKPWLLRICPGYVLTPQGDEISISAEVLFDVATCLTESDDPCAFSRPCPPVTRRAREQSTLYLAVRYVECQARPVRVAPVGCNCDDVDCEYSRIRDGYELCCLSELPKTHTAALPECETLCAPQTVLPCPECTDEPWVVLATITLPERDASITADEVDPLRDRRALYSTALLQELAFCFCRRIA